MATDRRSYNRWLLACAVAAGATSPVAAQTGGFGRPTLTAARPESGEQATGTRRGANGGATTAGQGTGLAGAWSAIPWDEVAAVAEQLAVDLGIEFVEPWEEGLWVLLVARFVLDIDLSAWPGSSGHAGRSSDRSSQSGRPVLSAGGTGGFGIAGLRPGPAGGRTAGADPAGVGR